MRKKENWMVFGRRVKYNGLIGVIDKFNEFDYKGTIIVFWFDVRIDGILHTVHPELIEPLS